jgi:hypothetical protein
VVHARELRKQPLAVYVGRGSCPCRSPNCCHEATFGVGMWGNPFAVDRHGLDAMRLYLDFLAETPAHVAAAREKLRGRVLACWCAPRLCHGEVLARLADGEPLEAIRADVLAQVEALRAPKAQPGPGPLFGAP